MEKKMENLMETAIEKMYKTTLENKTTDSSRGIMERKMETTIL